MKIVSIEGVGATYASKLQRAGVRTTHRLLEVASDKRGREDLARETGISETHILEWVNHADLMRIKGVGEEYSDLLEEAGVDTVKELRQRRADNLHAAMIELNFKKRLVRRPPSLREVQRWVSQAKSMEPRITY